MIKLKILFISHGFPCYMSDIIYHGLVKLGHEVIDYPFSPHYHGEIFRGLNEFGIQVWSNDFVWKIQEGSRNYLKSMNFNFPVISCEKPLEEKYDLIVLTSHRPEEPYILKEIGDRYYGKTPIVFIDGEENKLISQELMKTVPCDLYFMREYRTNENYPAKVKPIHFAVISDWPKPNRNEDYSVSLICSSMNMPNRLKALDEVRRVPNGYSFDSAGRWIDYGFYIDILSRSKIGLSLKGVGHDTLRFWEILYYCGFLMSERLDIPLEGFENLQNIVWFDTNNCRDLIDYYIGNDRERERIAKNAQELVMNYHTSQKRAQYILEYIVTK